MTQPMHLPAGEHLPAYDDEPRVDPAALLEWLRQHHSSSGWAMPLEFDEPSRLVVTGQQHTLIREVLQALQAVGDAQLVKNATYRAMARDGREVERLSAWLANNEPLAVVEHMGDPVGAAIALMSGGAP